MTKQTPSLLDAQVLDKLLEGRNPATVLRADGLLSELKKVLTIRMLNTDMGIYTNAAAEQTVDLHRSDLSQKTVCEDSGELVLSIPYDQQGHFDQQCPTRFCHEKSN